MKLFNSHPPFTLNGDNLPSVEGKYFKIFKVHTHICAKCYAKCSRDGAYLGLVLWGQFRPSVRPRLGVNR